MLGIYYCIIGCYHKTFSQNEQKMVRYLHKSANHGNTEAMDILGLYYQFREDHENMLRYFLMAIERNNAFSMMHLALYYQSIENITDAIHYCVMSIEKNLSYLKKFYQQIGIEIMTYLVNNKRELLERFIERYTDITYVQINDYECPISLDELNDGYELKCGHVFSINVLKCKTCPLYRENVI